MYAPVSDNQCASGTIHNGGTPRDLDHFLPLRVINKNTLLWFEPGSSFYNLCSGNVWRQYIVLKKNRSFAYLRTFHVIFSRSSGCSAAHGELVTVIINYKNKACAIFNVTYKFECCLHYATDSGYSWEHPRSYKLLSTHIIYCINIVYKIKYMYSQF